MKLFGFIFLIHVFASTLAWAQTPASEDTYFFKVSKSLRGVPPSFEERAEFEKAKSAGQAEAFIQAKIQAYMQDDKFYVKLKQKVDELFLFQGQTDFKGLKNDGKAYDRFIFNVIKNNLSWDQLLLGKSYSFTKSTVFEFPPARELDFFRVSLDDQNVNPSYEDYLLPADNSIVYTIDFPADDQRVAGAITTPRFFARYVNTALNKNRRRAAAVFRIFLCDAMAPSVPALDENGEKQDFETIFPDHKALTEDQIRSNLSNDIHGDLPDCKACHYKLDPLGQVFGLSAATLSPMASPGALRFKGTYGRAADVPLRGVGDLGVQLTRQPEYLQCQVRHFWDWYVGKDIPVSRKRQEALNQKFEELGRKPHEFITYLLNVPEYRQKPVALTEDQVLARRAVRVLKNCNACHFVQDEDDDMKKWDMTDLPYGTNTIERVRALRKIKKELDIAHDGANRKMPPKDSLWKLGTDDFNLLKKWIRHGAPDFSGTPQVAPSPADI
jgi:hypothetical protein